MYIGESAVFIGKDRSPVFRDVIAETNFFFVFEAEGTSKTEGHALLKHIHTLHKKKKTFESLSDFEDWIQHTVLAQNIPAHFSLAAGAIVKNILYVKTVGTGEVHMRRGKDFVRLIHGDKSASGYVEEKDMMVFTTAAFRELIENEEKLEKTLNHDKPDKLVDTLEEFYDKKDDGGTVCIFSHVAEGQAEEDNEVVGEYDEEDIPLGFRGRAEEESPAMAHAAMEEDLNEFEDRVVSEPRLAGTPKASVTAAGVAAGAGAAAPAGGASAAADSANHTPHYHSRAVESTELEEDIPPARRAVEQDLIVDEERGARYGSLDDSGIVNNDRDKKPSGPSIVDKMKGIFANREPQQKTSKIITFIAVAVIFVIFVWSVVFGYQRRKLAEEKKQIVAAEQVINQKTTEAQDLAYLDMDRALQLIEESKTELNTLKAGVDQKKHVNDLARLEETIKSTENAIVQKEEAEAQEFYDLALEDKEAAGDIMFLDGDKLAILDKANDTVYNFSLDKKSLEKSSNAVAGTASLVGMNDGVIYVFVEGKGMYEFVNDEKVELVIENDKDWGEITDFDFYGNNIYMLDNGKSNVYKYLVTEDGYADKASYFIGTAPAISNGNSVEIDSSLYVGQGDSILKFTRGEADDFKTTFPNSNVALTKIYTDENTEKVYAWDKEHATMYVLDKNGTYERQIKSSVLAKATDFVVYDGQILLLSGSKLFALGEAESAGDTEE